MGSDDEDVCGVPTIEGVCSGMAKQAPPMKMCVWWLVDSTCRDACMVRTSSLGLIHECMDMVENVTKLNFRIVLEFCSKLANEICVIIYVWRTYLHVILAICNFLGGFLVTLQ